MDYNFLELSYIPVYCVVNSFLFVGCFSFDWASKKLRTGRTWNLLQVQWQSVCMASFSVDIAAHAFRLASCVMAIISVAVMTLLMNSAALTVSIHSCSHS